MDLDRLEVHRKWEISVYRARRIVAALCGRLTGAANGIGGQDGAGGGGRFVDLNHYTFRFFSQRFLDEDWYHTAHVWVPESPCEEAKGKMFLASLVNQNKYPEVLFDGYGKRTAAVVGVPLRGQFKHERAPKLGFYSTQIGLRIEEYV
jgi:hypothetical protein